VASGKVGTVGTATGGLFGTGGTTVGTGGTSNAGGTEHGRDTGTGDR
jgi:hypothetical protein